MANDRYFAVVLEVHHGRIYTQLLGITGNNAYRGLKNAAQIQPPDEPLLSCREKLHCEGARTDVRDSRCNPDGDGSCLHRPGRDTPIRAERG